MSVDTWLRQIADRISSARAAREWTQDQLAKKARISRKTISQLENGKNVQVRHLFRILRALHLDPWTLLGGTSPQVHAASDEQQAVHDMLQDLLESSDNIPDMVTGAIKSFHNSYGRRKR